MTIFRDPHAIFTLNRLDEVDILRIDGEEVMLTRGHTKHGMSVTLFIEIRGKFKFTATYDALKDIYTPCRYNTKKFRKPKLELFNGFTKNDAEHYLVMFKLNASGTIRYDL